MHLCHIRGFAIITDWAGKVKLKLRMEDDSPRFVPFSLASSHLLTTLITPLPAKRVQMRVPPKCAMLGGRGGPFPLESNPSPPLWSLVVVFVISLPNCDGGLIFFQQLSNKSHKNQFTRYALELRHFKFVIFLRQFVL